MSLAFTRQSPEVRPGAGSPTPAPNCPPPGVFADAIPSAPPATRPIDLPQAGKVALLRAELRRSSPTFAALEAADPEPCRALRRFGLLEWEAGRLAGAVEAFTAALSLSPGDADLWRDLAFAFQAVGHAGAALTAIRRALGLAPDEARSWLMCANLLAQGDDHDGAEAAFRQAILRDPALSDAHFALGLMLFERRRYAEAARHLADALALVPDHAMAALCLGQARYLGGDFAGAAEAFAVCGALMPLPDTARRNLARARAFTALLSGDVDAALAAHAAIAGADGEEADSLLYAAFSMLSAYGHTEAAIAVGRYRLARQPGDPVQAYLLDALCGCPLTAAPVSYLESHFDAFAPTFDEKLVGLLLYRVPQQLAALAARHRHHCADVLDLGCGTGLGAAPLSALAGRLTGVDVADGMLAEAAKRGLYGDLVKAEAVDFLRGAPQRYDLLFAADLLTYFGDLAPLFAAAAAALRPGGLFCLSIETVEGRNYALLPSGRFAHAPAHVVALAARDFATLEDLAQDLRLEGQAPVPGRLLVFERRR